jgi:hypothetical protein
MFKRLFQAKVLNLNIFGAFVYFKTIYLFALILSVIHQRIFNVDHSYFDQNPMTQYIKR